MLKNNPEITVLMPAYNAEKYIAGAIASVLNQTFINFELLIINDGSTDNTPQIIQSFKDNRITLINQSSNEGISNALNKGLKYARADFIARFDADDICHVDRLQKQIDFLNSHPDYVITGSDAEYISATGNHLCFFECNGHSHEEISKDIYSCCPFTHSSVMYRKETVIQCGGYPIYAHTFEDYLLWIKLSKWGRFYNFPEPLIKVRFSPSSVTIDEKWRGKDFLKLKGKIIKKGAVTEEQGHNLLSIIRRRDTHRIKKGAYHALCAKKFLFNNYQPVKARSHTKRAIISSPFRIDNYVLLAVSYLPLYFVLWLYKKSRRSF